MTLDVLLARAELYRRAKPSRAVAKFVQSHGLDWRNIEAHAGLLAVLPVVFYEDGRFDFADGGGTEAFIIEALAEDGESVLDLAAWATDKPGAAATMFGQAGVVGASAASNPATYFGGRPLQLHRTPADWLISGCDGIAVVMPRLAAWTLLQVPGRIACRDRVHAREIAKLIKSTFDLGRLVVPTEGRTVVPTARAA